MERSCYETIRIRHGKQQSYPEKEGRVIQDFTSFLRDIYMAREYLNNQLGQRKDPNATDYIWYTWNDFCETFGLARQTVNSWLRKFVPAELSEDDTDHYNGRIPLFWRVAQNLNRINNSCLKARTVMQMKRRAG